MQSSPGWTRTSDPLINSISPFSTFSKNPSVDYQQLKITPETHIRTSLELYQLEAENSNKSSCLDKKSFSMTTGDAA